MNKKISNIDEHGRIANKPEEFEATESEINIFDAGLFLGFARRLEVLLEACPIKIYSASSLKHPWPYRLQNATGCYPASFWRSQHRMMDSAITAPKLSNKDVLDKAVERQATEVCAKDYMPFDMYEDLHEKGRLSEENIEAARKLKKEYGDNVTATTHSIKEFVEIHDPDKHPPAYIPIQMPYDEHVSIVRELIEDSHIEERYMLGGLKDASPNKRIDALLDFRSEAGSEPTAHGLGWGLSDELVSTIRKEPNLLDSVDNSTPSQALRNSRILDKHWESKPFPVVNEGQYQNTVLGLFEFATLIQTVHRLTEYNEEFEEVEEQSTLKGF